MDSGIMDIFKEKGTSKYLIIANFMATLWMIKKEAMDMNNYTMVISMKDSTFRTNLKEWAPIYGKLAVTIMGSSRMVIVLVKVNGCLQQETFIMVILNKI